VLDRVPHFRRRDCKSKLPPVLDHRATRHTGRTARGTGPLIASLQAFDEHT
jgi:hypothetical protein